MFCIDAVPAAGLPEEESHAVTPAGSQTGTGLPPHVRPDPLKCTCLIIIHITFMHGEKLSQKTLLF